MASQCSSMVVRAVSGSPARMAVDDGVVLLVGVLDVDAQHRDRPEQLAERRLGAG